MSVSEKIKIGKQGMLSDELIVRHESMGNPKQNLRRLVLQGEIAQYAQSGQFVHLQVSPNPTLDPLLRRPISIAEINQEKGQITLLYKVIGKGTKLLSQARVGERLSVMGPIGTGFSLPRSGELWLVAGGIGIFPLYALAQWAQQNNLPVRLFWGGQHGEFMQCAGLKDWQDLPVDLHLCTMDGSMGKAGLVTEILENGYLEYKKEHPEDGEIHVACCGPHGMMEAVSRLCASLELPLEVSLEERMGSAVGACLG